MFLANADNQNQNYSNINEDMTKCKELIESLCNNQIKTKESLEEISQLLA